MTTKRIHIDFQKIINEGYLDEDLLLIYQWVIRIGRECNEQNGWNRYGLHQSFHGYGKNNEPHEVYPLNRNWKKVIYDGFVRILCKSKHPSVVDKFLLENRIKIDSKRAIKILEDGENMSYDKIRHHRSCDILDYITTAYKGLELKKEFFHPDYPDRIHPRIIDNIKFGTNGLKWYAWFTFSFECLDYEPGWEYTIPQNENENITSFFNRVANTIDNLLTPADNCDNCPMWVENRNHGDYLRHGYRGSCWNNGTCKKPNIVEYKWWSDDSGVHDNAIHHSIVFPYYRNR